MPANLLRQPLLHFLLLGAAIFIFYQFTAAPVESTDDDAQRIVVSRNDLLDFMQYRARSFGTSEFSARLDSLDAPELDALVTDYVREEALYREALAMGMNQGDYIIRQRLVQKVEFLLENLASVMPEPDEDALHAYFDMHRDDYRIAPTYDFTHVFFDAQQGGMDSARTRAERWIAQAGALDAAVASSAGDRFPFLQDYAGRTHDFVINNFGGEFVAALDRLSPDDDNWQGPIASRYGYHLVWLRERTEARLPDFTEARARVLDDYRYQNLLEARRTAEESVVAEYEVVRAF